jgi:hypothetical protein
MGTMTEEKFEEFLKTTLHDLDPVPPTPREAMWTRIEAERRLAKQPRKTNVWLTWGVGLAAMLAVGVGIGRLSVKNASDDTTPQVASAPARVETPAPAQINRAAYDQTVAEHMTSAEALLTSFKTQPQGTVDPQLSDWARDLLTNTRMLLDSPAADDPDVAVLLEDLELIIAQIARVSASSKEEREIIRDGMKKTEVLPRLRASQSAGT